MTRQQRDPAMLPDRRTLRSLLALLLVLVATAACDSKSEDDANEPQPSNEQAQGTEAEVEGANDETDASADIRLISTSGALTEIVYELGLGDMVVGVDTSSTYPAATQQLPRVGYYRALSAEGLVSLNPTHILVGPDAGPAEVLRQVGETDVEIARVRKVTALEDVGPRITEVGAALDAPDAAAELRERVEAGLHELQQLAAIEGEPKGAFLYARGPETLLIAGDNTIAELMFELAGAANAVTGFEDFRPLSAEALVAAEPEFIVVPEKGLESIGGEAGLLRMPGVAQTPAGQNRAFFAVDDLRFLGGGPRVVEAAHDFRDSLTATFSSEDSE